MEPTESAFVIILVVVNLAAGFGLSVPMGRRLGEVTGKPHRYMGYAGMMVGVYFFESVAFVAGMATQVFSIGLAFAWGVVFGLWLRGRASPAKILQTSFFVALYTCIPTASFGILVLAGELIARKNVVSSQEGWAFGVPEFVPWPLCTILGFCLALVLGTLVFKTVIMTGEVSLLIHLKKEPVQKTVEHQNTGEIGNEKHLP